MSMRTSKKFGLRAHVVSDA